MPIMDELDINGIPAFLECILVCISLEIGGEESTTIVKESGIADLLLFHALQRLAASVLC